MGSVYRARDRSTGGHVAIKVVFERGAEALERFANEGNVLDDIRHPAIVGYIAREKGEPDLVIAVRIEEGKPTVARVGHLEMPVMSFELFRRIATNAITTPDLLADRPTRVESDATGR